MQLHSNTLILQYTNFIKLIVIYGKKKKKKYKREGVVFSFATHFAGCY